MAIRKKKRLRIGLVCPSRLQVKLPEEEAAEVIDLASKEDVSVSTFIRKALKREVIRVKRMRRIKGNV